MFGVKKMLYTEKVEDKLIISKDRMAVLPNQKEVEDMINLENDQLALWKEIKGAVTRKVRIDNDYDFKIGSRALAEFVSVMFFGGMDLAVLVSYISGFDFRINPVSVLVASNIALASSIFVCAKSNYKLKREKKRVNVEFSTIKDVMHDEINRQNDLQRAIPGDNTSLTNSYVKIKTL